MIPVSSPSNEMWLRNRFLSSSTRTSEALGKGQNKGRSGASGRNQTYALTCIRTICRKLFSRRRSSSEPFLRRDRRCPHPEDSDYRLRDRPLLSPGLSSLCLCLLPYP